MLHLCFDSSTWSIYSLAHGQRRQPAQRLVPSHTKTSGHYWNINNDSREVNKTFQHLLPSQLPCQKQGCKWKGGETHSGCLDPWCLQLSTQPCSHTNKCRQGSLWPSFPPSHGVLCHCETATEFQLHNDDERDFKRPHAVRLMVRRQPLSRCPCLLREPPPRRAPAATWGRGAALRGSTAAGSYSNPPLSPELLFLPPSPPHLPGQLSLSDCTEVSSTSSLPLETFTLPRPLPPPRCLAQTWPCR